MTDDLPGIEIKTPMECNRCGTCCTRHQAIADDDEIRLIANHMSMPVQEWIKKYTDPRWPGERNHLLRHDETGCVFLRQEQGITTCEIHTVRPACCRDWVPSLEHPECRDGLKKTK